MKYSQKKRQVAADIAVAVAVAVDEASVGLEVLTMIAGREFVLVPFE